MFPLDGERKKKGSAGKVLVAQVWWPEFRSQEPMQESGLEVFIYNVSAGGRGAGQDRDMQIMGVHKLWASGSVGDPVSNNQVENYREEHPTLTSGLHIHIHGWESIHTHTYTYTHTHTYTLTLTHTHPKVVIWELPSGLRKDNALKGYKGLGCGSVGGFHAWQRVKLWVQVQAPQKLGIVVHTWSPALT